LILPDGLDDAVRAGTQPTVTVVRRAAAEDSAAWIDPTIGGAVRELTGRPEPATVADEVQPPASAGILGAAERLGSVELLAGVALLLLPTLVGTMIVPALLQEEVDRKMLSALLLVASPGQVIAGKGLTGLAYLALLAPIVVVVSGLRPAQPLLIAAAVALFGIWLIEVGLVLGLIVERRTYEQAGPVAALMVLLLPAVLAVGVGSGGAKVLGMLWPAAAAAWLVLDSLTGVDLYTAGPWAVLVLLGWAIGTYAVLVEIVRRREL
jgi:hypothetical protein